MVFPSKEKAGDYTIRKTRVELLWKWPDSSTWLDNVTVMAGETEDPAFFTFTRWMRRPSSVGPATT